MAGSLIRDPNNPIDEERRRKRGLLERAQAATLGLAAQQQQRAVQGVQAVGGAYREGGVPQAINEGLQRANHALTQEIADPAYNLWTGEGRETPNAGSAPVFSRAPAAPAPANSGMTRADVRINDGSATTTMDEVRGAANSRSGGLTRIVKTADGTYIQTADPNVKGQERIYDEVGNRADRGDEIGGTSVTDAYNRQQNGLSRMGTAEGREEILAQGKRSLATLAGLQSEQGQRREKEFLDSMSPKERVDLLEAQAKEQGLDRRAAAQLAATREGGRAALINAQTNAEVQGQKIDQYERERLSDPETRTAAFREFFGSLPADEESRIGALLNTQRGKRIMDAAEQAAAQGSGNATASVAGTKRSNGLVRFLGGDPFTDDSQMVGGRFDPADYGLSERDYELLIKAAQQRYVGQ